MILCSRRLILCDLVSPPWASGAGAEILGVVPRLGTGTWVVALGFTCAEVTLREGFWLMGGSRDVRLETLFRLKRVLLSLWLIKFGISRREQ